MSESENESDTAPKSDIQVQLDEDEKEGDTSSQKNISSNNLNHKPNIEHCNAFKDKMVIYFDGFTFTQSTENIIAWFWGTFILFIGVIFVVAQYTTPLKSHTFVTTYWLLFAFMLISVIGMSIAIRNRSNRSFIIDDDNDDGDYNTSMVNTNKYLMGNAYVFAIGNFVIDIFAVLSVFHCGMSDTTSTETGQYTVKFVFHFIRIIFYALQLIFLQIFICTKIHRQFQLFIKLLIVHNIATNFNIWFTFVSQDTGVFRDNSDMNTGEYNILPCTSSANDTVFGIAKDTSNSLSPFIFEFSILVASLFYSIYPVKDDGINERSRRKYNYGAIDAVKRDDSKLYKSDPGILFGILIVLLLAVSSWCIEDNLHYLASLRFAYIMQIIVQVLICISSISILQEIKKYHTKDRPDRKYTITDYLLLGTGLLGFLPFLFAILFSVSKKIDFHSTNLPANVIDCLTENDTEVKLYLGIIAVFNTMSVLIQLFVLLTAQSYKRVEFARTRRDSSYDVDDYNINYRKLRSSARVGQWVLFLLILNLGLWVTNSFFEMKDDLVRTYATASVYWHPKPWSIITKLFYPLLIFFRFHSVAMLFKLWVNFRVKRKLL